LASSIYILSAPLNRSLVDFVWKENTVAIGFQAFGVKFLNSVVSCLLHWVCYRFTMALEFRGGVNYRI